jgi:hypothetical protein
MDVALPGLWRSVRRCRVCGFAELRTDEVVERGIVLLAECPRCEHRFTLRVAAAPASARRVRAQGDREVAPAA